MFKHYLPITGDNGKEVFIQILEAPGSDTTDTTHVSKKAPSAQALGKCSRSSTSRAFGVGGEGAGCGWKLGPSSNLRKLTFKSAWDDLLAPETCCSQVVGVLSAWGDPQTCLSVRSLGALLSRPADSGDSAKEELIVFSYYSISIIRVFDYGSF